MYKPGNLSRPPPVVAPHQPRLDWQMWFAALGPHTHSPWFTSLVLRLLQGKEPGAKRGGEGQGGEGDKRGRGAYYGRHTDPSRCSDPPHPESSGQLSLPQAAAHLRPSPALQVLVLPAWGAGVRPGTGWHVEPGEQG